MYGKKIGGLETEKEMLINRGYFNHEILIMIKSVLLIRKA